MYLCNAFSLNMLTKYPAQICVSLLGLEQVRAHIATPRNSNSARSGSGTVVPTPPPFISAVGHADTARVFSAVLGVEVVENRVNVRLDQPHNELIVGQYTGPRLEAGATALPDGARIEWLLVEVDYD
jgi:hypothetical protein